MPHYALGWACTLNDLFVRFPYERFKSIMLGWKGKFKRRLIVKRVFKTGLHYIIDDIIENNATFKIQGIGYQGGELHMEAITGSDFEDARSKGKFADIDFLESFFTGYLMYLYVHGKRDNFLHRRKFPVYIGKEYKDKLVKYTNEGKQYC